MSAWCVHFLGCKGTILLEWKTPPKILRTGDNSLWLLEDAALGIARYVPAVIEEQRWLHPIRDRDTSFPGG
jgi:hypothetical protein